MKHLQKYQSFLLEQQTTNDLATRYINKSIPLPNENQTYSLPYKVTCGYEATNRDQLHAFQDTKSNGKSYDVGNMNLIVKKWLDYFYSKGINPQVSAVDITVNGMEVTWTVTIDKSKDGKAWVGFTSRGSAGSESIADQNLDSGKQNVKKLFPGCEIEDVYTHRHMPNGLFGFVQHFIKYTNPDKYPPHSKSAGGTKSVSSSSTSSSSNVNVPSGQVLKVKDVKNLKVGDVLVGTRMTGVNFDVEEPGLYELRLSEPIDLIARENVFDVEIDGENKGLYLDWNYRDNSDQPLVLSGNMETGHFVDLRKK